MLVKLLKVVKHPGFKYGVPAGGAGLSMLTLGLLHPVTLGIIALGIVGNFLLHKKGL